MCGNRQYVRRHRGGRGIWCATTHQVPGQWSTTAAGLADGSAVGIMPSAGGWPADPMFVACANLAKVYAPRTGRAGFTGYYGRGVSDVSLVSNSPIPNIYLIQIPLPS